MSRGKAILNGTMYKHLPFQEIFDMEKTFSKHYGQYCVFIFSMTRNKQYVFARTVRIL